MALIHRQDTRQVNVGNITIGGKTRLSSSL